VSGREGADAFETIAVVGIQGGGKAPYVDDAIGAEESQEGMRDMVLEDFIGREGRGSDEDLGVKSLEIWREGKKANLVEVRRGDEVGVVGVVREKLARLCGGSD